MALTKPRGVPIKRSMKLRSTSPKANKAPSGQMNLFNPNPGTPSYHTLVNEYGISAAIPRLPRPTSMSKALVRYTAPVAKSARARMGMTPGFEANKRREQERKAGKEWIPRKLMKMPSPQAVLRNTTGTTIPYRLPLYKVSSGPGPNRKRLTAAAAASADVAQRWANAGGKYARRGTRNAYDFASQQGRRGARNAYDLGRRGLEVGARTAYDAARQGMDYVKSTQSGRRADKFAYDNRRKLMGAALLLFLAKKRKKMVDAAKREALKSLKRGKNSRAWSKTWDKHTRVTRFGGAASSAPPMLKRSSSSISWASSMSASPSPKRRSPRYSSASSVASLSPSSVASLGASSVASLSPSSVASLSPGYLSAHSSPSVRRSSSASWTSSMSASPSRSPSMSVSTVRRLLNKLWVLCEKAIYFGGVVGVLYEIAHNREALYNMLYGGGGGGPGNGGGGDISGGGGGGAGGGGGGAGVSEGDLMHIVRTAMDTMGVVGIAGAIVALTALVSAATLYLKRRGDMVNQLPPVVPPAKKKPPAKKARKSTETAPKKGKAAPRKAVGKAKAARKPAPKKGKRKGASKKSGVKGRA